VLTGWLAFGILSGGLVFISRQSLRSPRSHGFFRFWAWECILALFLINIKFWFHDPTSWRQLLSWSLLILSLIPLFLGISALKNRGKPVEKREDAPELLAFEKTSTLVTTGIYRYIRHPLYSSLLFLAWGIFFKMPTWYGVLFACAASVLLLATARADEKECVQYFGAPYQEYMKKTRMFVPFVF